MLGGCGPQRNAASSSIPGLLRPALVVGPRVVRCNQAREVAFGLDGEGVEDPTRHLTCHQIKDQGAKPPQPKFATHVVFTANQFGAGQLEVKKPRLLCLPATKMDLGTP